MCCYLKNHNGLERKHTHTTAYEIKINDAKHTTATTIHMHTNTMASSRCAVLNCAQCCVMIFPLCLHYTWASSSSSSSSSCNKLTCVLFEKRKKTQKESNTHKHKRKHIYTQIIKSLASTVAVAYLFI